MSHASLALVLHAHLPFVPHAGRDEVSEERWLRTAITSTYVPLLDTLDALARDRVPLRLTLALSPTLLGMLADRLLRERYLHHLDRLVALAEKEERRTRHDPRFHRLARMYLARFYRARVVFLDEWQRDLTAAFRAYQERGLLDVITTTASHAELPLLSPSPGVVRAQVEVAAAEHRRYFYQPADGLWLPGCAYEPGLEVELARVGLRYFFVDARALAHAIPRPVYGGYAPVACGEGVAAFACDPEGVAEVSPPAGYAGHAVYRNFDRDIGLDLPLEHVRAYLPAGGRRLHTGLKYFCNADTEGEPEPYDPEAAREQVERHAAVFVEARERQARWLARTMDRPPLIVCAFDATLFGHRWFEGWWWLDLVARRVAASTTIRLATPADDLARHPRLQRATPGSASSRGYQESWLHGRSDWVYRHLHASAERLHALCRRYPGADEQTRRALTQALRELLLAQADDWALLMGRDQTAAYAHARTRAHLLRCQRLCAEVEAERIDDAHLAALEDTDNVFPALDYRVFT
jgi:1,4-alpha-glucan branching enzyme